MGPSRRNELAVLALVAPDELAEVKLGPGVGVVGRLPLELDLAGVVVDADNPCTASVGAS